MFSCSILGYYTLTGGTCLSPASMSSSGEAEQEAAHASLPFFQSHATKAHVIAQTRTAQQCAS